MGNVKGKNFKKKSLILILAPLLAISALGLFLAQGPGIFGLGGPQTSISQAQEEHQLFVYGTLRFAPVRHLVFGGGGEPVAASLPGYRRQRLDIVSDRQGEVHGLLLTLDDAQLAALDRYERLGRRYERVRVRLADGTEAWVYRRLRSE